MNQPVTFTWAGFRKGVRLSVPLLIGTAPFGVVCGIVAQGAGLSYLETFLMSGLVYAGSAQLVALATWTHPASALAAGFAAFVVNLRLALMGPVLAPWFDRLRGWRLWASLFVMADQNWALGVRAMNAGERDAAQLLGTGVPMLLTWVATSMLGRVLGAGLRPAPGHPIFFAALAVFICMLVTLWRGARDLLPWGVAGAVAVATARLLPHTSWYIVAGALAGSLAGAIRDRMQA
ncbi:MAG: AzlC family ABC transporter permease [Rhodospirillales bacterium]|nr:AzlC family ABC transporter permease [Rhodospirillales bacterium]